MKSTGHQFGGNWTEEKLERVRKYLVAYAKIMSKQKFHSAYIDAFAGTGYRTLKQNEDQDELMLPGFTDQDALQFLDGSARIALRVQPRFSTYILSKKIRNVLPSCKS